METRKLRSDDNIEKEEITRTGISAAPGIVIGPAFVMDPEFLSVPNEAIAPSKVEAEVAKFLKALDVTQGELRSIKSKLASQLGEDHARIFDAHMLILDDVMVKEDTERMIRSDGCSAAWAFQKVISRVIASLSETEDEYLKERSIDILDVEKRVIRRLLGKRKRLNNPSVPSVVVAHQLSPSDTAQLDRRMVLGYVTDLGGRTSHTAILARSQGVAAVVGVEDLSRHIQTGDAVIVDGNCGAIVVNPLDDTLAEYEEQIVRYHELEEQLLTLTGYPAETLDGHRIGLMANIDLPEEVKSASAYGGEGVGLFRTEYFFIAQEKLPTEEEQFAVYSAVVRHMRDRPVTIRALDIGGDKIAGYLHGSEELNPFMGWRGIRFLLTRKDIFKTQLRAIYRTSRHGKVRLLLPLVAQVEEVLRTKAICEEVRSELRSRRYRFEDIEIGVMIETPSAVMLASELAREVDFFSIGTNDLIQYTMAVDRGNSKISHLYQHLHPSIVRLLKMAVDAGRKAKIPVAVCGEMAVDPLSTIVLIGLQVDEFSCSPKMMPEVKKIIRSVTLDECKTLVAGIAKCASSEEIESKVRKLLKERWPDLRILDEGGSG